MERPRERVVTPIKNKYTIRKWKLWIRADGGEVGWESWEALLQTIESDLVCHWKQSIFLCLLFIFSASFSHWNLTQSFYSLLDFNLKRRVRLEGSITGARKREPLIYGAEPLNDILHVKSYFTSVLHSFPSNRQIRMCSEKDLRGQLNQ